MTLGLLILIIIGVILFIWANIYSFKEATAYPAPDDGVAFLTFLVDITLIVAGFIIFLNWALTIKLW